MQMLLTPDAHAMADKGPTWHGARRVSTSPVYSHPPKLTCLERLDFGTDPPRVTRVEAVVRIPQHSMSIGSLESQPGGDNLVRLVPSHHELGTTRGPLSPYENRAMYYTRARGNLSIKPECP